MAKKEEKKFYVLEDRGYPLTLDKAKAHAESLIKNYGHDNCTIVEIVAVVKRKNEVVWS